MKKLSKNPQKIQGYRSRYAHSQNLACLRTRSNIFEIFGVNLEFSEISENRDISVGDSGKTVGVIKETRPEVTFAS